ncbi:hypothetical protein LLG96_17395 [bacterium]|nr:hypothetical protein [bacterium]
MKDWDYIHRAVDAINDRLLTADTEEDLQAVGLCCREALISLAQAVYDADTHPQTDSVTPSATDAKRMFDAYIAAVLPGSGNEEARKFARDAVALADALQHRRTAVRADGELAAAAVESVVRVVEIISGQEPHSREPWQGVELQERYFAWSGPGLHALEDWPPVPTPSGLPDAIRAAGMVPSFCMRDRLYHHLAQGCLQLYETDRRKWRRELNTGDIKQVLLVKAE